MSDGGRGRIISPQLLVLALLMVGLATTVLWVFRPLLDKAHMALAFLLVVLGASARHGRRLGLTVAVLCFLCFNFFLLPPYYTFALADRLDWIVLFTFLITGGVAAHLFERAQRESRSAHERADELTRLSDLGAETLSAPRAEDAVAIVVQMIREVLRLDRCDVCVQESDSLRVVPAVDPDSVHRPPAMQPLIEIAASKGTVASLARDGTIHVAPARDGSLESLLSETPGSTALAFPLRVRERIVGAMYLQRDGGIHIDADTARFAGTLASYAALGVERIRLTDEETRAAALRETNRAKDALLAAVSHDLRTPLTTIRGLAHEIRLEGDDRAATIEEEAERLNRLVADLLDLSSIEAGAVALDPEVVAGEELIGATLQRIGPGSERVTTSLPGADVLPLGRLDLAQSVRALSNVIENALKYSPPDARVEVHLTQDDRWMAIDILDRGPGIPPSEAEHVFQPFYRGKRRDAQVSGTGLGLAIARRLADAQGGSITFSPRGGGGSIFTLRLPAATMPDLPGDSS